MSGTVRKNVLIALIIAAIFFVAYAFLPLTAPHISASPDENANWYFAKLFAATGELRHEDALNAVAPGLIHPRSMRVVGTFLVPGGFLGLPVLYGTIAAFFGTNVLPYLTPLVALLGVAAWGLLVAHFFGRKIGFIAALLLAAHPVWWYETSRILAPNVLFASLTMIAAWLLLVEPIKTKSRLLQQLNAPIAGIFAGLALAVRTSEAYWLVVIDAILLAFIFPRIPWKRAMTFIIFCILTFTPFLLLNKSVYGALLATGYSATLELPGVALSHGRGAALLGPLGKYLFPLGFAPRNALQHFMTYGVEFFWWWSVLVGAALVALVSEMWRLRSTKIRISRPARIFAVTALVVSAWLILFYGSWNVQDNSDPRAVTIGTSYLRYWLPIFIFSTVPVAWLVTRAAEVLSPLRRRAFLVIFALLFLLSAASDVFLSPQEGLFALRRTLFADEKIAATVIAHTEVDALIVVDRADKLLFPARRVITPLRSDATYAAVAELVGHVPTYYFGITFPESDLRWLRETKLPSLGVTIDPVTTIGVQTLYRFTKQ